MLSEDSILRNFDGTRDLSRNGVRMAKSHLFHSIDLGIRCKCVGLANGNMARTVFFTGI